MIQANLDHPAPLVRLVHQAHQDKLDHQEVVVKLAPRDHRAVLVL